MVSGEKRHAGCAHYIDNTIHFVLFSSVCSARCTSLFQCATFIFSHALLSVYFRTRSNATQRIATAQLGSPCGCGLGSKAHTQTHSVVHKGSSSVLSSLLFHSHRARVSAIFSPANLMRLRIGWPAQTRSKRNALYAHTHTVRVLHVITRTRWLLAVCARTAVCRSRADVLRCCAVAAAAVLQSFPLR